MIRRLLLTSVATALLSGVASAADLPRQAPPPLPPPPPPLFTWTGFYAGFNLGYGFDASNHNNTATVIGVGPGATPATSLFLANAGGVLVPATGVVAFGGRNSIDGFSGGGQIGYNYQFTPGSGVVIGFEADAQYVDFGRDRNRFAFTPGLNPGALVFNPNGLSGLDFFGTVRGRLGYAWDRTLLYGTGGFAYGSGGGRDFGLPNGSNNDFKTGWTAGGGIEYALPTDSFLNFFRSSAVTIRVEGLYVNLDRGTGLNGAFAVVGGRTYRVSDADVAALAIANRRRSDEFAVVRAGVNYKFGSY